MKRREVNPPVVFGLDVNEAAASVGVSATKFREKVSTGEMPRPRRLDGRLLWDVDEIRAAFKALPHDGGEFEEVDSWASVA